MTSTAQILSHSENVKVFGRAAYLHHVDPEIRLYYVESFPSDRQKKTKGTILLVHGFPQTSYQFRHVMAPLAEAGYHVIAPDLLGHGFSSKPIGNINQQDPFTARSLAKDLYQLVTEHIGVKEKIHLVGYDIGGIVTHPYVCQFPESVASVTWGENLLPGSKFYDMYKHTRKMWHFDFHSHNTELAVALVSGKERLYVKYFFDRQMQNQTVFPPEVVDFYAQQYAAPDSLRCAFLVYRAFEADAADNLKWRQEAGKVKVKNMMLSGERSFHADEAVEMAREFYEDVQIGTVPEAGHYLAEENPKGFVDELLKFIES
ncbi:hypothetical protein Z517_03591 [Fonsecaea pedrosoi CBS 271.37]|uniref:AB hydrolase-1 domain-containing protein n=1 Tax=Fonsecaea pedrosoi CBS 271.37 TaxID=1442368 RepID=A0A0D2E2N8_9EURO|nr:uncharacterized protein Z517_03591 [Fonsecaea pedrosoi CBS 271.37]KIW84341.1 hypothetical protein Z517_03591 [Fonsecaea pedrosoi CBS 271.37]